MALRESASSQLDAIDRQHHARLRFKPSRLLIFASLRSLTWTGSNNVPGSSTEMNGRNARIQSDHASPPSTRRIHSASMSADERKSSRLGSQAWQSLSFAYHALALSRSTSPNGRSWTVSAYSNANVSANAVLKCVPTRIGYVAFGRNSRNRRTNASSSGSKVRDHRRPSSLS